MIHINKSIIISLLCNLFHYYSFSIYAFSAVILSPIFFSTDESDVTKLFGLMTLSGLLLLKPLGNLVFGYIGDKYGRKLALFYSLISITIATSCIGLIPSYASIGWLSSASLIICLFVQGICMGGQYTGAIIFIQEHMQKHQASFCCGLMVGIGVLGTLIGTATSFLFYNLKELSWTWRIPFLLTFIIGALLCYCMKYMTETPIFIKNKTLQSSNQIPFLYILKNYKRTLCAAIFISSVPVSMFYLATVYFPNFYGGINNKTGNSISLQLTCLAQILCMIFIPTLGYIADKIGKKTQLKLTSVFLVIFPIILFYYIDNIQNIYVVIAGVVILSFFASLYSGPAPAVLSENFPVIGRYSGMGISISIGEGLFGGLSPLICLALVNFFNSKIAPAYFIIFVGTISLLGVFMLSKSKHNSIQEVGRNYLGIKSVM